MKVLRLLLLATSVVLLLPASPSAQVTAGLARIDHVSDGDTVTLTNGYRVRFVQIDTPEVYFAPECYGRQASALTKRLLPPGTIVRLSAEPATDRVDRYGRLLRYVIRARDGLDINLYLVRIGAAAPYFYDGRHGRYAAETPATRHGGHGSCTSGSGDAARERRGIPTAASPAAPPRATRRAASC